MKFKYSIGDENEVLRRLHTLKKRYIEADIHLHTTPYGETWKWIINNGQFHTPMPFVMEQYKQLFRNPGIYKVWETSIDLDHIGEAVQKQTYLSLLTENTFIRNIEKEKAEQQIAFYSFMSETNKEKITSDEILKIVLYKIKQIFFFNDYLREYAYIIKQLHSKMSVNESQAFQHDINVLRAIGNEVKASPQDMEILNCLITNVSFLIGQDWGYNQKHDQKLLFRKDWIRIRKLSRYQLLMPETEYLEMIDLLEYYIKFNVKSKYVKKLLLSQERQLAIQNPKYIFY